MCSFVCVCVYYPVCYLWLYAYVCVCRKAHVRIDLVHSLFTNVLGGFKFVFVYVLCCVHAMLYVVVYLYIDVFSVSAILLFNELNGFVAYY